MTKYYVEAYDHEGKQILGNLDGQGVIKAKNYRRTQHYKKLYQGKVGSSSRVHCWKIVDENGNVLEVIYKPTKIKQVLPMEAPVKQRYITHPSGVIHNHYEYYVTGRGAFPFDMLRFDQAWPATTDDAIGLSRTDNVHIRSIRLMSCKPPTIERWESFGWSVGLEKL